MRVNNKGRVAVFAYRLSTVRDTQSTRLRGFVKSIHSVSLILSLAQMTPSLLSASASASDVSTTLSLWSSNSLMWFRYCSLPICVGCVDVGAGFEQAANDGVMAIETSQVQWGRIIRGTSAPKHSSNSQRSSRQQE